MAVMKINSELGYRPVIYSELTDDDQFWKGCESCVNYSILQSKGRKNCLCTAMLFDPKHDTVKIPIDQELLEHKDEEKNSESGASGPGVYEFIEIKR